VSSQNEKLEPVNDSVIADQTVEPLPEREELSLLSTGGSSLISGYEDLGAAAETPQAGDTTDSATGTAGGAAATTDETAGMAGSDASGSESETASATEDDRSESFSQSDSAVSQT
jgi:hypothetical protein